MGNIIVLTGGGSAGHVTPNLALVDVLRERGFQPHYIGTEAGIERDMVRGLPYHVIEAGKLRRYLSKQNISDLFKIFRGYRQAKKILGELKPSLVFAKGGFVSVPVAWAASKLGVPVVLHESDYTPGLANRLCTKKAQKICLSFDTPRARGGKGVLTGSPVRAELLRGDRGEGLSCLGFTGARPVLLIVGGSLGARAINEAVDGCLDLLTDKYDVVHVRGNGNLNSMLDGRPSYRQFEYVGKELPDILAATDICLSRAGANAIFEFLALRIPALLVPLPLSASRGDQILNANYFREQGFARVLEQEKINRESLAAALDQLYASRDTLVANMDKSGTPNGTENVLHIIEQSVREWK
jgi:UDP-N-acetylglucosamine--N-acetylmuramyl-(pentapeptide) pyrophosphoryl-undecaprenol N-acetylglucosamine transferase